MAIENQAVGAICNEVNEQFETLVNIMNDISDGYLDAVVNGERVAGILTNLGGNDYGYDMAGIQLHVADRQGSGHFARVNDGLGIDANSPGTMLQLSTGTSNQQLFTGQLGDLVTKAASQKKAMAQKAGQF